MTKIGQLMAVDKEMFYLGTGKMRPHTPLGLGLRDWKGPVPKEGTCARVLWQTAGEMAAPLVSNSSSERGSLNPSLRLGSLK